TSGQVEVSNREIKSLLVRTVNANRANLEISLDDALWACRIAYKTPIGASPYQLVYGKAFYLSIKLDHKALWALKKVNLEWKDAAKSRLNSITYEISAIHKDKMKLYHDRKIEKWVLEKGNQVLLYNSKLYLFPGKLTSRCNGPFIFSKVYSYGAIELQKNGSTLFK
ncbi:uncharacterized protein LOC124892663, partial [Capsicum annuum]|uniref:uncharacterized protein LOC124892663 n=1 Tax=Capsicum annuum TaxID=4072 RepID=UPI001FB0B31E